MPGSTDGDGDDSPVVTPPTESDDPNLVPLLTEFKNGVSHYLEAITNRMESIDNRMKARAVEENRVLHSIFQAAGVVLAVGGFLVGSIASVLSLLSQKPKPEMTLLWNTVAGYSLVVCLLGVAVFFCLRRSD